MRRAIGALVVVVLGALGCTSEAPDSVLRQPQRYTETIDLPAPTLDGAVSLEAALAARRSQREYAPEEIPLDITSQLLWAAQGITDDAGHRTAPSAGALYPLEIYVVTGERFMHFLPADHRVEQRPDETILGELTSTAFDQRFVSTAPMVIVIAGVQSRTEAEYGAVAGDLMNREAGHAAQNVLLQATALGLGAVPVGGFDPAAVSRLLALPPGELVLYLIPVGFPPS